MQTPKEKAEEYVRKQIPELMELSFGCEVKQQKTGVSGLLVGTPENDNGFGYWFNANGTIYPILGEHIEIIGHPIQPHHWLKCVVEATKNNNWMLNYRNEIVDMTNFGNRHFKNEYLIIGTERFYQSFNTIVGI